MDNKGTSPSQPCTWIRPYTLTQYGVDDYIQVVGHTPTDHITNIKDELIDYATQHNINPEKYKDYVDVWCCDCLANKEYLIIEDGKFKPCKF